MAFWRPILDFLVGAAGPADIVVTHEAAGVRLRLPNQRYDRGTATGWLMAALGIGAFILNFAVHAALKAAEEERDLDGPLILMGVIAAVILFLACIWRVVWHYEFILTPHSLRVECITTFLGTRTATVNLEPIQQLTIIRIDKNCTLQAESPAGPSRPFFRNQDYDSMHRLATLLAEQHARLTPGRAALRVTVEEPHKESSADRSEPPLNSQVALTHPGTGVTLDFPLPEDGRLRARRSAWCAFEIGVLLLVGAVIWFAVCSSADWPSLLTLAYIMFMVGIGTLIAAANQGRAAWYENQRDDDLRQLSVVGNMLIRTARAHRKKAWYRGEISTIRASVVVVYANSEGGTSSVSHFLSLVLELHNGEKVNLVGRPYEPSADYRPKAEYEWVATRLRQALLVDAGEPAERVEGADASSQAIKQMPAWIKEARSS